MNILLSQYKSLKQKLYFQCQYWSKKRGKLPWLVPTMPLETTAVCFAALMVHVEVLVYSDSENATATARVLTVRIKSQQH